ncbi:hypothetical protein BH09PAT2_BH09PAT2_07630 [soil metagenome]
MSDIDIDSEKGIDTKFTPPLQDLEFAATPPTVVDRMKFYIDDLVKEKKGLEQSKDPSRLDEVADYFDTHDEYLGMTPLEKLAEVYSLLGDDVDKTAVEEHAQSLLRLAYEQHLENPPYYLSHGFDHTMNVLRHTEMILKQNPSTVENMAQKYDLPPHMAKFMLLNVTCFHDVGYPYVKDRGKAVHSFIGAGIVSDSKNRELYRKLLKLPGDDDTLLNDFTKSILYHNADSKEAIFRAKVSCEGGDLLISEDTDISVIIDDLVTNPVIGGVHSITVMNEDQLHMISQFLESQNISGIQVELMGLGENYTPILIGRPLDKEVKGDKKLGIEYHDAHPEEDPMGALIRLADNIDICESRFNGVQNEDAFKAIYLMYGDDRKPESQLLKRLERKDTSAVEDVQTILKANAHTEMPTSLDDARASWKKYLAEKVLQEYPDLDDAKRAKIFKEVQYLDSEQLKHWGGSDSIKDVILQGSTLSIIVDPEKFKKFSQIPITEIRRDRQGNEQMIQLNVGMYQIWRTQQAYSSLKIGNGHGIQIKVRDTLGNFIHVPNITESRLD